MTENNTRTRLSAEERRGALIEAAAAEFAIGGLAGTSTHDIARRTRISQPYIFQLFGSKKELFIAACELSFEQIRAAFAAAAAGAEDPMAAMAAAYLELLADRSSLMVQLHSYAASSDQGVRDSVRREFGALAQLVQRLSGAEPAEVRDFLGRGLLLNIWAALDLAELVGSEPWAAWLAQGSSVDGVRSSPPNTKKRGLHA